MMAVFLEFTTVAAAVVDEGLGSYDCHFDDVVMLVIGLSDE